MVDCTHGLGLTPNDCFHRHRFKRGPVCLHAVLEQAAVSFFFSGRNSFNRARYLIVRLHGPR